MKKIAVLLLCCLLLSGCASPAPAASEPPETTEAPLSLTLFLPDDNAEKLEPKEVTVSEITAETILQQLILEGVLPEDVEINAFTCQSSEMTIDFNAPFAQLMNSMGTSGEYMIMGSVVNTFLTAFGAERVTVTVNGGTLETGHSIYDTPLSLYP